MSRIFLLSPANCNGVRAGWILGPKARCDLARRLRCPEGAPLGEVFSFLSALYFRGKLAYAREFARPPGQNAGVLIITPSAGLLPAGTMVHLSKVRGFSRVPITVKNRRYCSSLRSSARRLSRTLGADCQVILLGSIASGKYLDILGEEFGDRLRVPLEFVGLGDMSRGALLLRCVREQRQLNYVPVAAASVRSRSVDASCETAQPSERSLL